MARISTTAESRGPSRCRCHEARMPMHGHPYWMVDIKVIKVLIDHEILDAIRIAAGKLFFSQIFDLFLVPAIEFSEYFDTNRLEEPKCSNRTPFGLAAGYPEKSLYEVLEVLPGRASTFSDAMAVALGGTPLTGFIPAAGYVLQFPTEEIRGISEQGGILGPVRKVVTDFFRDQPTKGYAPYTCVRTCDNQLTMHTGSSPHHINQVLNYRPDEDCVQVLGNVRKACAPDLRVLASEQLLPNKAPLSGAAGDILMVNFGGRLRNERMLGDVAPKGGLEISSLSKDMGSTSAVIEMVPVYRARHLRAKRGTVQGQEIDVKVQADPCNQYV
ncbi:hypothetical protein DL769_004012 [Monosporascus sp. CRB-8-3]|nr:hypothetical protein DL769_004012 [Monosporascus sp. CRB-8-3]